MAAINGFRAAKWFVSTFPCIICSDRGLKDGPSFAVVLRELVCIQNCNILLSLNGQAKLGFC